MDAAGFRRHRHRFFGRTALVATDPARVLEIDDPHDLARARALAPLLDAAPTPTRADVDAVVLDFDGTQTDDRVWIDSEGRETVAVHRGDGLGIAALRRAGLHLLILSTERNPVVAARARKLHVPVLHGIDRKDLALKHWCEEYGVDPQRVLYAGNDVNDLPCFEPRRLAGRRGRRPRTRPRRRARAVIDHRAVRGRPRDRGLAPRTRAHRPPHRVTRSLTPHRVAGSRTRLVRQRPTTKRVDHERPPSAHLGTRTVGPGRAVYVTGEIGINHNGDLDNAFKLIDAAAEADATPSSSEAHPEICTPATSGTSSATPVGSG